jgi:hypothetical protein
MSFLEITRDKLNRIVGTPGAQGRKLGQGIFAYRLSLELHP